MYLIVAVVSLRVICFELSIADLPARYYFALITDRPLCGITRLRDQRFKDLRYNQKSTKHVGTPGSTIAI